MEIEKVLRNADRIGVVLRRFELITVARYRDKSKMKKAAETMDKVREKTKGKGISMTKIIRKWRDTRYGSSSS